MILLKDSHAITTHYFILQPATILISLLVNPWLIQLYIQSSGQSFKKYVVNA